MGDVIHNLPMVTDVAEHILGAQIDWVVEEAFADIPALHPKVNRVIPVALRCWRKKIFNTSVWREIKATKRRLREHNYDVVLDSQGLLKSALLARFAQGKIFGPDRLSAREPLAAKLYHRTFSIAKDRHAVLRNRELAAQVFDYPIPQTPPDYGINLAGSAAPAEFPQKYIVCLHATSRDSKLWPESHWMALASQLAWVGITPVFPWGSERERLRAQIIAHQIKEAVILPKTSLKRLAEIIHHARAVVGVDTGLAHLAAAIGCPTVAVYIDTDPMLTGVLSANPARAVNLGNKGAPPSVPDVMAALTRMQAYPA